MAIIQVIFVLSPSKLCPRINLQRLSGHSEATCAKHVTRGSDCGWFTIRRCDFLCGACALTRIFVWNRRTTACSSWRGLGFELLGSGRLHYVLLLLCYSHLSETLWYCELAVGSREKFDTPPPPHPILARKHFSGRGGGAK